MALSGKIKFEPLIEANKDLIKNAFLGDAPGNWHRLPEIFEVNNTILFPIYPAAGGISAHAIGYVTGVLNTTNPTTISAGFELTDDLMATQHFLNGFIIPCILKAACFELYTNPHIVISGVLGGAGEVWGRYDHANPVDCVQCLVYRPPFAAWKHGMCPQCLYSTYQLPWEKANPSKVLATIHAPATVAPVINLNTPVNQTPPTPWPGANPTKKNWGSWGFGEGSLGRESMPPPVTKPTCRWCKGTKKIDSGFAAQWECEECK